MSLNKHVSKLFGTIDSKSSHQESEVIKVAQPSSKDALCPLLEYQISRASSCHG